MPVYDFSFLARCTDESLRLAYTECKSRYASGFNEPAKTQAFSYLNSIFPLFIETTKLGYGPTSISELFQMSRSVNYVLLLHKVIRHEKSEFYLKTHLANFHHYIQSPLPVSWLDQDQLLKNIFGSHLEECDVTESVEAIDFVCGDGALPPLGEQTAFALRTMYDQGLRQVYEASEQWCIPTSLIEPLSLLAQNSDAAYLKHIHALTDPGASQKSRTAL